MGGRGLCTLTKLQGAQSTARRPCLSQLHTSSWPLLLLWFVHCAAACSSITYICLCTLHFNRTAGQTEIRDKTQKLSFLVRIDVCPRPANCLKDSRETGQEPDFAMQDIQPRAAAPLSVPFRPETSHYSFVSIILGPESPENQSLIQSP